MISRLTKSYDFVSHQEGGFSAIESIGLLKNDNTEEINWHLADDLLSLPPLLLTQVTFKVTSPKHLKDTYKNCVLIKWIKEEKVQVILLVRDCRPRVEYFTVKFSIQTTKGTYILNYLHV